MQARWWLMLSLLTGCPDRTISEVPTVNGSVEVKDFPANPRRDLDILFLIDNSRSMKEEQDSLKANFHRFISVLESIQGGLPNVHIGVATSDLGTSASDGTNAGARFGCTATGDAGALRPLANGARFIVDSADGTGRNYTGTLDDAFTQIADVGIDGCGIEQHLGSVAKALDPANAVNAGFLRDGAYLAIVVIGDEDDCSLAHGGLFDGTTDGDVVNFRCTEDGVACDTPATDFMGASGARSDCHPKPSPRWLEQPTHFADVIRGLKAEPRDVIVAGILGPTDGFAITTNAAGTTILDHSCTYTGPTQTQVAFPAVRTAAFLEAFPARFTNERICDQDLSPALTAIAKQIVDAVGSRCFDANLADLDPNTSGAQYSCSVVEVRRTANHPDEELAVLPPCPATGATGACWNVIVDDADCGSSAADPHLALDIQWNGVAHDDSTYITADCVTSDGGSGTFQ